MEIRRGQIWWVDLGEPRGSSPGYERPVVIVQADRFNKTSINTVVVSIITTTLRLAEMPGNVAISSMVSGLEDDSVINLTQLFTVDKTDLSEYVGALPAKKVAQISSGLKLILL